MRERTRTRGLKGKMETDNSLGGKQGEGGDGEREVGRMEIGFLLHFGWEANRDDKTGAV